MGGFSRIKLGRTNLEVSRLGIGSSYGADADMIEAAYDRGINYFWWGAFRTSKMAEGVKRVARKNREDMVIVTHTNAQFGAQLPRLVKKTLQKMGIDYVDILLLGWRNKLPSKGLLESAVKLRGKGLVNHIAVSGHNRRMFPEFEKENIFDVFHVRYNAAHRGAEKEIFDKMPETGGPGIVSFTNTRWGGLLNPKNMPAGMSPPDPCDCYRFVLSHPKVHVATCGPNNMKELHEDLAALEKGPMDEDELARMKAIGDHVYQHVPMAADTVKGMSSIFYKKAG